MLPALSNATTVDFKTNTPNSWFGTGLKESYDIAVLIDNPALKGANVTGIKVNVPADAKLINATGWLSKELTIKQVNGKKVNVPDLVNASGNISDGILSVVFEQPIECDGNAFYAGYSFAVDDKTGAEKPVAVSEGKDNGNLFIHTSRKYSTWKNIGTDNNISGCPILVLDVMPADNSASFSFPSKNYVADDSKYINGFISNYGTEPVRSIDYEYKIGSVHGKGTADINIKASEWGLTQRIAIPVTDVPSPGTYESSFTITKVNGHDNQNPSATTVAKVSVLAFMPVNRPLVEEYTGLWCAWCPAGYVMMEQMNADYGQDFVGIAYHNADQMACIPTNEYPSSPGGFPKAFINRGEGIKPLELREIWKGCRSDYIPADLTVSIDSCDSETLKATARIHFAEDLQNPNLKLSYVLVGDGLTDPDWAQQNHYAGDTSVSGPFWDLFTKGGNPVKGLTFNDVALLSPRPNGINGCFPSEIKAGDEISHTYTFHLDEIKTEFGNTLPIINERLRVVTVLIDGKTNKPINAAKSLYADGTGHDSVDEINESVIVDTKWYDLEGRPLTEPQQGISIRIDRLSDGSVKCSKAARF